MGWKVLVGVMEKNWLKTKVGLAKTSKRRGTRERQKTPRGRVAKKKENKLLLSNPTGSTKNEGAGGCVNQGNRWLSPAAA